MSPKTVPTAPCKMPSSKVVRPQVVITTSPHPTPAPHHMPSPPNFYGMLQHAVKRDAHQVILAVLQHPLFAQAVIGLCNTAAAFSSTPADCTRYLGSIGWTFADQANFPLLADQKDSTAVNSFFVFADAIIKTANNHHELQCQCKAAVKQCHEREDHDIKMLASHLDLLTHCFNTLNLFLSSPQFELDSKSKPKKVKITPFVANYKPGSKTALLPLGQIDALLEAHPVINGHSLAPLEDLKKQRDMVELAAEQQLHLLDMTLQTYKLIVACLSHLDKALSPINVDLASSLLTALNISFKSAPKDSDVKPANPSMAEPQNPLELLSTPAL
ncbi:hypothetical protein J132_01068 [Termitomyces sp. J132]|nr:hypothetical protein J132_01068 [Termitomyces sp. J132]